MLGATELEGLVDRELVADAVARVFAEIATGGAAQPAPTSMGTPAGDGRYILMSAVSEGMGLAAVKLLADLPGNAARGLPTQRSMILVVDRVDGAPVALLHGGVPTRVRTAAASAVATGALAREDSRVLGLIGAGALAHEHVRALRSVRPFERLVVWSRSPETVARFAATVDWPGPVVAASTPEEVVGAADVVCTLTPAVEPIVHGAWLRPGQHLNVVGARPRPDEREVDGEALARASVWVDDHATARTKSGDLLLAVAEGAVTLDDVIGTLGDVLAGASRGRLTADEITLFDSVGIGAQDLAVADVLVRAARSRGVGTELDLTA